MKILTVVTSAGQDPWLSIERLAQEPIISKMTNQPGPVVWVAVDPSRDRSLGVNIISRLLQWQIDAAYSRRKWLRTIVKRQLKRRGFKAFGHRRYLKAAASWLSRGNTAEAPSRVKLSFPTSMSLKPAITVATLRYALQNYDFDYLLRITSTCLPVYEELIGLAEQLPSKRVYAGAPMSFAGIDFASGAALLLSRDVAAAIVKNAVDYPSGIYEDVGLGWLVNQHDLGDFFPMDRLEIRSPADIQPPIFGLWPGVPIIRCKAEEPKTLSSETVIRNMWEARSAMANSRLSS